VSRLAKIGLGLVLTVVAGLLALTPADTPPPSPNDGTQVVEQYWPNGRLRLRKHVLRLSDGTTVDHGTFERWHDNGNLEYTAVFDHGKKQGTTVRYHRNGQRSSLQEYRNGKRDGVSIAWNEKGEKVKEEHWADGRPDGTWTIWEDGKVQWRHVYDHGDPDPESPSHSTGASGGNRKDLER
jgi:antitoxin component YwqK of YwqJK toxin-antitoxin module